MIGRTRTGLRLIVLALVALLLVAPVGAQEAWDALTEAPEATEGPPIVVVTPDAPDVDFGALGQFALYMMLALAGGGSFALVLTRLDTRGKDQLERAYESLSPTWQDAILQLVNTMEALAKLGREVTDHEPNDTPPNPPRASPTIPPSFPPPLN